MGLKAALDPPDPCAYKSTLPIHQDGTCNGLQHYVALGGDACGGRQVNLETTDLERHPDNKFTKMLVRKVPRKVVKQTIMTTVYGVTFVGTQEQIERQLKDRGDVPLEEWSHMKNEEIQ